MGDADALFLRILETKARDKRSATTIHRNHDGVEPSPGDEVDRAVPGRRPGAGAKLPTEPVCQTLHGGRHRVAGYGRRGTRNGSAAQRHRRFCTESFINTAINGTGGWQRSRCRTFTICAKTKLTGRGESPI